METSSNLATSAALEPIKAALNPQQLAIVTHGPGHMLVLAGAGSGKTRVLVHRIAYLVANGCTPSEIMAVTFTNKAANEMRSRLTKLLNMSCSKMWLGTFHGLAHRFLRQYHALAQLDANFQIMDQEDQKRLIKELHRQFNLDEDRYPHAKTQDFINHQKERGLRFNASLQENSSLERINMLRVYEAYEARCKQSGLVDFAELLLSTVEILTNNLELRELYASQFKYLLIDEFQDTNLMQYRLVKLLSKKGYILAVGDDDQSIYSWRGAEVANMRRLQEDFHPLELIRLEQNYRSTSSILSAANQVIANNADRFGKTLWTNLGEGEAVSVVHAANGRDEAKFVIGEITRRVATGASYDDLAVLYRASHQSRIIEEGLARAGVPYRIFGSTRFYDRAEIKDALAYLRLMISPNDELALLRVINVPSRGIGEVSLQHLKLEAATQKQPLMQCIENIVNNSSAFSVKPKLLASLNDLVATLKHLRAKVPLLSLAELLTTIVVELELDKFYRAKDPETAQSREENLKELINGAKQFELDHEQDDFSQLELIQEYLASLALEADSIINNQASAANNAAVSLMTVHAAKGLEFPVVFMVGMEEGLFPNQKAVRDNDVSGLEEERRLCYVGMTRAKTKLYLTYASYRKTPWSDGEMREKSRFLTELPLNQVEFKELDSFSSDYQHQQRHFIKKPFYAAFTRPSKPSPKPSSLTIEADGGFKLQQKVFHEVYGYGIIVGFNGSGQVQVLFNQLANNQLKIIAPSFLKITS